MSTIQPITTESLILLPSSIEVERAILADRKIIESITQFHVPDLWPGNDWIDALGLLIDMYEEHPDWCGWNRIIAHQGDSTLIGSIGCICPPQEDGEVTIGYYIVPDYRKQGYATEAAQAYAQWLKSQPIVKKIKAECLIDNAASIRILERIGMRQYSTIDDDEGRKIQWEMITCIK